MDKVLIRSVMTFGRLNEEDKDKTYTDLVYRNLYV